jgi:3-dehydroquinate dehydratase/shikimate dehydrogenase
MICVSIGRTRHQMMIAEHQALADAGARLVEYRIDWLKTPPNISRLLEKRPTPIVMTCRRREDHGRWNGTEEQRQTLIRSAIVAGVEFIDIEMDIAKAVPRYGKTRRIISYHNFDETPADLEKIYEEMLKLDGDIVKIVTMANSAADGVRMMKLLQSAPKPTVAFCMGEFGLFTRVICGRFGSPYSYASFSSERELAPGQVSFKDMVEVYHYDDIKKDTKMFGVIGDPISHSLSPLLHNTTFHQEGFKGIYVPLRIQQDQLATCITGLKEIGFEGFSVTIPHKENVISQAHHADERVKESGAANTLFKATSGAWVAANTDLEAAMQTIRAGMKTPTGEQISLEGKRILILGAGGVARAIALGLMQAGAVVTLTNRTRKRGEELAVQLKCAHITWENRGAEFYDVLVNCTPIGMHPNVDASPMRDNWLREGALVFDTIYTPENTLLIKQARERECRVASGLEMFVRQAAAQYECFTQTVAPLEKMRKTLRQAISPVKLEN